MSDLSYPDRPNKPSIFGQPWGTTWRKALVSLPRLVPDAALRFTSPDGPHPIITKIPSRGKHQIPVYIFVPPSVALSNLDYRKSNGNKLCPVLLDFHGGGFVLGSCQEQAPFCAKLSRELDCIAISVDYRLGPYAQFPAALEDAEDILLAVLDPSKPGHRELRRAINDSLPEPTHSNADITLPTTKSPVELDTTRLALSGFSSGGNLALNLVLNVPTTPPLQPINWPSPVPPSHTTTIPLLLFYPALDTRLLPHERPLPTGHSAPKGFLASLNLEAELMPTYLPRHMTEHPRASPCLVALDEDTLHPAAKTLLVLPEFDAITPQSQTWVERVRGEGRGADLEVQLVPGMLHGWTQFPDPWLDDVARGRKRECFDRAVAFAREAWGGGEVNVRRQSC